MGNLPSCSKLHVLSKSPSGLRLLVQLILSERASMRCWAEIKAGNGQEAANKNNRNQFQPPKGCNPFHGEPVRFAPESRSARSWLKSQSVVSWFKLTLV